MDDCVRNSKEQKRDREDRSELYQFSSVYRHFVLNKYPVVRGRFDTRSAKPYYLCTVVLLNISKDPDIVNSYELLSEVISQHATRRMWKLRVKQATRKGGVAGWGQNGEL